MGSTVVAAVLTNGGMSLVNVGDSRAYLVQGGELVQISYDQSFVSDLYREGQITREEMRSHPQRNRLSMSINEKREQVEPVIKEFEINLQDQVILCSDGLWSVVSEEEILYYVQNFPPQTAANDLIRQALEYGGPDNISVIIAQRTEPKRKFLLFTRGL